MTDLRPRSRPASPADFSERLRWGLGLGIPVSVAVFIAEPAVRSLHFSVIAQAASLCVLYDVAVCICTFAVVTAILFFTGRQPLSRLLFIHASAANLPVILLLSRIAPFSFAAFLAVPWSASVVLLLSETRPWGPTSITIAAGLLTLSLEGLLLTSLGDDMFWSAFLLTSCGFFLNIILYKNDLKVSSTGRKYSSMTAVCIFMALLVWGSYSGRTRTRARDEQPGGPHVHVTRLVAAKTRTAPKAPTPLPRVLPPPVILAHGRGHREFGLPGVILLPELTSSRVLTLPISGAKSPITATSTEIPFDGFYAIFESSSVAPPRDAAVERSTPVERVFRTATGGPLVMQAVQDLAGSISLANVTGVVVRIQNAEPRFGFVGLELSLTDHNSGTLLLGSQLLGTRQVKGNPGQEEVWFPVPRETTIDRFDGLRFVFRRDRLLTDSTVRIAIICFRLVIR